jgi:hypothetical protein
MYPRLWRPPPDRLEGPLSVILRQPEGETVAEWSVPSEGS